MPSRLASLIRRARRLSGERDRLVESLAILAVKREPEALDRAQRRPKIVLRREFR